MSNTIMKLAPTLWIVLALCLIVFGSSLYVIRASCYNRTVAEVTKQQLSDRNKDCKPSIDVSLTTKKLASHIYFSLMFVIPILLFITFVLSFKQRADKRDEEDQLTGHNS